MRIRTKLTILLIGISFLVIITAGVFSVLTLNAYFRSRIVDDLKVQSREIEFILRNSTVPDSGLFQYFQHLAQSANLRLTLIDPDGKVLFESNLSPAQVGMMENHLHRPEIEEAQRSGTGINVRHSATLNLEMLYFARTMSEPLPSSSKFSNTKFLRVGIPLTQVYDVLSDIRSKIILTSLAALVLIVVVSLLVARRLSSLMNEIAAIAEEIRAGDLSKRLPIRSHDEVGMLAITLNGLIDQLNEEIEKLRKLERVRSEFLGNVSHELRTPIFTIQGLLETLVDGAVDDATVNRTFLKKVQANASRLNTLLEDLIEISRIESGEMRMSFRYFCLNEFLESVVGEFSPVADRQNVKLRGDLLTNPTVQAYGDRERLRQVLSNLIENGIRYNKNGGEVVVGSRLKDTDRVEIRVEDTGIGIADEHLTRIFERFYRVDKNRSREVGGTGLGLAIVKHILEAHNSRVEVESTPGKGSVFRFTLRKG